MTSLRLINLSEITALEPFTSSHKHDVAVQSCTDEDDDSVTLAHTDGTVLAFSEPNQTAEIAWKCDDGDHITAIAWFYVTTKLSILMTGFQSGMIRVFDRAGNALFSQHLHRGGIMSLKSCPSVGLQRSTTYDLLAVYSDILLHIEGESIFNSLCSSISQSRHRSVMRDEPSVMSSFTTAWRFCKYQLQGQSSVHDVIPIAHPRKSLSVNPMTACFLGVGANPMLAVYPVFGQGGASTFSAVNVAAAVATKLTSAVFSFVSNKVWGTSSEQPKEVSAEVKAQQDPPHSLPLQRSIRDSSRTLTSISSSPDSKLAATCDSFGRVILWDLQRMLAIRVFKGYRDAQTEFVTLKDRERAEPVLFLAIYLGRRGLLEVWRVPLGVRVGIVQVGTNCLLRSSMALTAHLSAPNQIPQLSMAFLIRASGAVARIVFDPNIHSLPADQFFLSNARLLAVDVAQRALAAARQQVLRWQRNHLCIHCATDVDLQNFELDSTVSSHDLFESLLRLCCLPTTVSVSVDSLLADLFPRVFPSQSPDTQFTMPAFCVGYLNDLIAMFERAVSETLAAVASLQPNLLLITSSASSPVLLPSSSVVPPPIDINSHAPTVARPVWSARTLARDAGACLALQQTRVHCLLLVALLRTYLEGVGNSRRTAPDHLSVERKSTHSKETSGIDDFDVDNFDSVPIATAGSKSSDSQNSTISIYDFLASFDCLSFFGEYATLWSAALADTQTLSVSSHTLSASTTVDSIAIRVASWSLPAQWSLDIHSLTGQTASNNSSGLNALLASQIRLRLKSDVTRNVQLSMQVARVLFAPVFVFLLESPLSESSENTNSFEIDAAFVSQAPISSLPLCGDDWLPWLPKVILSIACTPNVSEFLPFAPQFAPQAASLLPLLSCFAESEHISMQTRLLYRALSSRTTSSDSKSNIFAHRFVSVLHALQHALLCSTRAAVQADVRYTTFQQSVSAPASTSTTLSISMSTTVTASQRLPPLSSVVEHLSKHILPLLLELPSISSFSHVSASANVLLLATALAETSHRLSTTWIQVLQSSNDKRDATTHTISQIPWLRLQRRLLSAYLIDTSLSDPAGHNTALVSLAQLSTCSSMSSNIIAPYLLKLGLPLPALIACITSALPVVTNDTSAIINQITDLSSIQPDAEPSAWMSRAGSWRCASLESVLIAQAAPAKAAGKKALPPVVSRANPTTSLIERVHTAASALRNIHIAFPQHVFSDQQVGVALVIDLIKRFCQHQSAHARVPMTVYAKIDPIVAQAIAVIESLPRGVAAASCALLVWQCVFASAVSSWLNAAFESKITDVVTIRTPAILDLSIRLLKSLQSALAVTGIIGFRSLDQSSPDQVLELELEQLQQLSRLTGVSQHKLLRFKLHSQRSADLDQMNLHHLSMLARSVQRQPVDIHISDEHHVDEDEHNDDVELDEMLSSLDIVHKSVLMDSFLPAGDRQLSVMLSCLQITLAPLAPKFANQEHPLDAHINALMQVCAWLRVWVDVHATTVTESNNKVLDIAAPLSVFPLAALVSPGFTTSLMNPDAIQFANQSEFRLENIPPLPAQAPLSTQQAASARSACLSALARRLALATSVPALFQLPARASTSSWMSRLLALCDNDTTLTQALHASVLSAWLESWSDSLVEEQLLLIDEKHCLAASISRAALDRLACLTQFIVFIPATSPAHTQTLARRLVALISAVSVQKLAAHICSDVARRSLIARLDSVAASHKITTYSTDVVVEVFAVAVRACSHWLKLSAKWSPAETAQFAWAAETCTQLLAGLQAVTA